MDMIAVCLANWRLLLIGTLATLTVIQTARLDATKADLRTLEAQQESARQETTKAQAQSDATIERLRTAIPVMVDQAQINALANFQKRRGNDRSAGADCVPAHGLLRADSGAAAAQTGGAAGADATEPDRVADPALELAQQCGATTALYNAWRQWAGDNALPIKD